MSIVKIDPVITAAHCILRLCFSWWRHQMKTFSVLLSFCAGNSPVPVNSPHKGQWRGALMFSLICAWIHDWVNNREAGDLIRHRGHYDVIVMLAKCPTIHHVFVNEGLISWDVCGSHMKFLGLFNVDNLLRFSPQTFIMSRLRYSRVSKPLTVFSINYNFSWNTCRNILYMWGWFRHLLFVISCSLSVSLCLTASPSSLCT